MGGGGEGGARPGSVPGGRAAGGTEDPSPDSHSKVPDDGVGCSFWKPRRGIVFFTTSALPCGLGEGSRSAPGLGKFPRCLVATKSRLPQAEQMCSNIWSGRVYAFKVTTPTHEAETAR